MCVNILCDAKLAKVKSNELLIQKATIFVLLFCAIVIPPLLTLALSGADINSFIEFPPRPQAIRQPEFSLWIFASLSIVLALMLVPLTCRATFLKPVAKRGESFNFSSQQLAVPLFLLALSWAIAWTRFPILTFLQPHTFTLLWFSFIFCLWRLVSANRLYEDDKPGQIRFLMLFPMSALMWWMYEYLNRFVGNWSYHGVAHIGAFQYALWSSLAYASVLPALFLMQILVLRGVRIDRAFRHYLILPIRTVWKYSTIIGIASVFCMALCGVFPTILFALIWILPLILLVLLKKKFQLSTLFDSLEYGDWRGVISWSIAGLICGVFWEMWNYGSLCYWEYHIPFVAKFYIFEMPLLGFAGYLPFGIFCGELIELALNGGPQVNTKSISFEQRLMLFGEGSPLI